MPYSSNKTINGLEAETSIADTDELVFGDVSDTNRAKKITFANLKTEITGDDTAFVRKADYDANSILYATADNTPLALTIGTNSVVGRVGGNITTLAVDSDLSSVSANDDTVPSAKATKTALDLKANDSAVVKLTGDQTVAGVKTFSSDPIIPDEAYGSGWNGVLEPPTKNAVYDKILALEGAAASYDKVPNSNETSISYRTLYMPILVSGPDSSSGYFFTGWADSNITPTSGNIDGMGGFYSFPGSGDQAVYAQLASISASQTNLRFADLGASEVRIKFDLVPGVVAASERYAFGIGTQPTSIDFASTRTATATHAMRFVVEEDGGVDKLWAVNSNGSNYNATDITGAYTLTQSHILELVITSTSIKYYVDGTLVATHSTYISTSTSGCYLSYAFEHNGTGGARNIYPAVITLPTGR
jgi:hypothetical protein